MTFIFYGYFVLYDDPWFFIFATTFYCIYLFVFMGFTDFVVYNLHISGTWNELLSPDWSQGIIIYVTPTFMFGRGWSSIVHTKENKWLVKKKGSKEEMIN